MKRIVRLTESDLVRIVKRVVKESEDEVYDDNYERRGIVQRDKLNFEETKSGMERSINNFSLEHLIRLYNGENQIDSIFKKYKPLGLLSFDDLIDYKGGYEEDEY